MNVTGLFRDFCLRGFSLLNADLLNVLGLAGFGVSGVFEYARTNFHCFRSTEWDCIIFNAGSRQVSLRRKGLRRCTPVVVLQVERRTASKKKGQGKDSHHLIVPLQVKIPQFRAFLKAVLSLELPLPDLVLGGG